MCLSRFAKQERAEVRNIPSSTQRDPKTESILHTQLLTSRIMKSQKEVSLIQQKLTDALRSRVNEDTYTRWFQGMAFACSNETDIVFSVKDSMHLLWIDTNFKDLVQDIVLTVLGETKTVRFVLEEDDMSQGVPLRENQKAPKGKKANSDETKARLAFAASGLNPQYKFSNFVVGPNSQYAEAAAKAVAMSPKAQYNPLFIHGGSGLGKTHLMHAIGNEIASRRGPESVVYLTTEQFTNEFIDALRAPRDRRTDEMAKFRRKYRKAEVLLLDDVQFFGGKDHSQQEFFHTFNILFNAQKHIVLTSDRPACEIANLEPRLVSRFECGLTVDLQAPSLETRVAILRQKRDDMKVKVEDSVINFLAERISKNVRRLEGALMRIASFASLSGETPTFDRIENLLRDILREESQRAVTIELIQRQVAEHYDIRLADMTSRRRPANIAFARQVAMFLSRRMTRSSLVEIGEAFGGRDHGTVIHATKSIEEKMLQDRTLRDAVERLDAMLR